MNTSTLDRAQQLLHYRFHQPNLLLEALQAPSPGSVIGGVYLPQGNKRLALFGISVIALSVNQNGYEMELSKEQTAAELQARTSSNKLAQLARNSTLDMCVKMNPSQTNGKPPPLLLADTMKAVLAAVWIDCAYDVDVWTGVATTLKVIG